jgi:acyl-coenzyme A synthetase/AMP-(fatty) acid ligase
LDSIGKPAPNVQIRIVDEAGRACPTNECGAILIRGRQVAARYWNAPTESILVDGWISSGDTGYRDQDGYIFLSGREDDVIDVGGRKVYPAEVEAALKDLPAVRDCACVGIDGPENVPGKQIKAFLVSELDHSPPPERQELVRLLRESLEPHKIPTVFQWVQEIPKGTSGKVKRHLLRDSPKEDRPGRRG